MLTKREQRRFLPVLITDPTSENHMVRLRPTQSFILRLSDGAEISEVDTESHFFELTDVVRVGKFRHFTFCQKANFSDWSVLSSVHLGDVVLLKSDYRLVNLCVVLESSNIYKKDLISCINPEGWNVKILPHQVIEVILFDDFCISEWKCEVYEGKDHNIKLEQICSHVIERETQPLLLDEYDKRINDIFFAFPRSGDKRILEQHFWFRCDPDTITKIYSLVDGNYHAGKIVAMPRSGKHMLKTLNVVLGVKAKRRNDLHKSRLLPVKRDELHLPVVRYKPRYKFYNDRQYKQSDVWKNRESYNYVPKTEIQEVEMREKKFGSLEDGCKVETLKNVIANRVKHESQYQHSYE